MRLPFRARLLAIVGVATFGFVALIGVETLLTSRMETQLEVIREHYIPVMELGPRLEADFVRVQRAFQDSVSSQDREALAKTRVLRDKFLDALGKGGKAIAPETVRELRESFGTYYDSAYDVARRIISGETGVKLVSAMSIMQGKQARVTNLLKHSVALDPESLMKAFSAISAVQETSGRILVGISVFILFAVLLFSMTLGKTVIRALGDLSSGLTRFGKGDFSEPITVTSRDELGDVARDANLMAARIRTLLKEFESFSYSVAHDLRAPIRAMLGFSTLLLEEHGASMQPEARRLIDKVIAAAGRMAQLIESLLSLSRLTRTSLSRSQVDLSALAGDVIAELKNAAPGRKVDVRIPAGIVADGDRNLLHVVLTNLLGNAWKFTSKKADAAIEFGARQEGDTRVYFVKDNGAGFDMQYSDKLFGTFQRLHSGSEFEGTGIGLAMVRTIIERHGGEIWAESKPDMGATFRFTLWGSKPKLS